MADVIAKMLLIPHILCQMLYQDMMADIEPILWQMLLPIFNIVADVNTAYYIGCEVKCKTSMAGINANVADGIATVQLMFIG